MIKETFVTKLDKEFLIYDLITSSKNKNINNLDVIRLTNNLKFQLKKDI